MLTINRETYPARMLLLSAVSVAAWAAFATFFRLFWPATETAGSALFWIWLAVGGVVFVALSVVFFRLFEMPKTMVPAVAAALTAPALCLDVLTVTFFEAWYPWASPVDDRAYAAMILGGVGLILLTGITMGRPSQAEQAAD